MPAYDLAGYFGGNRMKKATETLSAKEIRKAVEALKKNERKPIWRFTWEFPFLKQFYVVYPEDHMAGENIDWFVKQILKRVPKTKI